MTKIRAHCPDCGDVEFGIDRIAVIGTQSEAAAYRFSCPGCGESVSRTAVPDVIELLLSAGVRRYDNAHPAAQSSAAAPLTNHDVETFRTLLQSSDWFEGLRASIEGS